MERVAAEDGVTGLTGLLAVLQLSDSAFPSGRYTLSCGLEALTQHGQLAVPSDPAVLETLLGDHVRSGIAPSDGVALACAHRATGAGQAVDLELVTRIDERLTSVKLAREARESSTRAGRALLSTAMTAFEPAAMLPYVERVSAGRCPGNHAVVLGLLSACLGVPRAEAVAGELYAFGANWVLAAVRLGVTDHRAAQGLLHRVRSVIADSAVWAIDQDMRRISSCTPLLDVMAMRHEEAELRLFAS